MSNYAMSNSPRLKEDQIKELHIISKKFGIPMTQIVRMALAEYILRHSETFYGTKRGNVRLEDKNAPKKRLEGKNDDKQSTCSPSNSKLSPTWL
jgi:hypothetical protein